MMTALFASAWAGTNYLQDIDRGVLDRMLTSPADRGARVIATMAYQAIQTLIQSLIIVAIVLVARARFPGGRFRSRHHVLVAVLPTLIFSALSDAVALLTRQQATLIAISQFTTLPLMFLSSAVMDLGLVPGWVGVVADHNPVEWAVDVAREAMGAHPDRARSGRTWGSSQQQPSSWACCPRAPSAPTGSRREVTVGSSRRSAGPPSTAGPPCRPTVTADNGNGRGRQDIMGAGMTDEFLSRPRSEHMAGAQRP
ncbi:ABC transporter permease [Streptomyces sp. NPDC006784]|uniref:ABC transporter permease n=1 Tax=Streptomyces sp. NPDC006784 TaxID=3364764 RepID=UPI0036B82D1A